MTDAQMIVEAIENLQTSLWGMACLIAGVIGTIISLRKK